MKKAGLLVFGLKGASQRLRISVYSFCKLKHGTRIARYGRLIQGWSLASWQKIGLIRQRPLL
jgi:hypothetical protein